AERTVLRVDGHVVGDEQVEVPIPVEIRKRAARPPRRRSDARYGCDIGEASRAGVAIQGIRAEARHVEIEPAVVIVVAGAGAHPIATMANAGPGGGVLERAISTVSE